MFSCKQRSEVSNYVQRIVVKLFKAILIFWFIFSFNLCDMTLLTRDFEGTGTNPDSIAAFIF